MLFKLCFCMCIIERAVEILILSTVNAVIKAKECPLIINTVIKWKPRLSVNRQQCCWSHVVIKPGRSEGFVKGKKRKEDGINENTHHWGFSRWCFAFQALAFLCLPCARAWLLLTVYLCMAYYWLEMGKRDHITQMTATWRINILLVLTTISGLPLFGHNVEVTA